MSQMSVATASAATAANDLVNEDEFVDAMDFLPSPPSTKTTTTCNYLERCGRWLMDIPRDDVVALQQTSEYRGFLAAFDKLGEVRFIPVVCNVLLIGILVIMYIPPSNRRILTPYHHLVRFFFISIPNIILYVFFFISIPTNIDASYHLVLSIFQAHRRTVNNNENDIPATNENNNNDVSLTSINQCNLQQPAPSCQRSTHPLSPSSQLRRRRYSFLQHLAVEDVLLRVFRFLDCSSLVKTGLTCHRFHELTKRSAEQRQNKTADGRLLRSAMKMLRAMEQIEGVGAIEGARPFITIPILGLSRRVKVSESGDPEFNGIYFCTGCNGNGYLFTKPRSPEQRARIVHHPHVEMAARNRRDNAIHENAVGIVGLVENDNDDNNNAETSAGVDVLFGDEPNKSRHLRCVIAKRFSNEVRQKKLICQLYAYFS